MSGFMPTPLLMCAVSPKVPPYLEDTAEEGSSSWEDLLDLHHWLRSGLDATRDADACRGDTTPLYLCRLGPPPTPRCGTASPVQLCLHPTLSW